jgi:hypothetical protein
LKTQRILVALSLSLLGACGGTPTGPAGPPNLSGVWQGTATDVVGDRRTFGVTLNLSQAPGSTRIEGTVVQSIAGARFEETITTGTQAGLSFTLQTVHTNDFGQSFRYTHNGTVDARGTEMNGGTLLGTLSSPSSTFTARRLP